MVAMSLGMFRYKPRCRAKQELSIIFLFYIIYICLQNRPINRAVLFWVAWLVYLSLLSRCIVYLL